MDYSPKDTVVDQMDEVRRLRDLLRTHSSLREKRYDKFREATVEEARLQVLSSLAWKDLERLQSGGFTLRPSNT